MRSLNINLANRIGNTKYVVQYKARKDMKILAQTDEQLVLQDKPIRYWLGAIPILMIGFSSWYSVIFGTNIAPKLSCDTLSVKPSAYSSREKQVNCTLERFNAIARTETFLEASID